jgi:hypothetical protein
MLALWRFTLLAAFAGAQWTYLDDASGAIEFMPASRWSYEVAQPTSRNLYNNTQSYCNASMAQYQFNFTGTAFALCSRTTPDAGSFIVTMCVLIDYRIRMRAQLRGQRRSSSVDRKCLCFNNGRRRQVLLHLYFQSLAVRSALCAHSECHEQVPLPRFSRRSVWCVCHRPRRRS